jgi:GR25 family glycosyltransferase involved in LPS biosynthesis
MYDIIILTNKHRDSLAVPHFKSKKPKIFVAEDWEYTPPDSNYMHGNEVGAYRCFKAHAEGMKMMSSDVALIMEDDCVPKYDTAWEEAIESAYSSIKDHGYDMACLYLNPDGAHPRTNGELISIKSIDWYKPLALNWFVGAVCYMVSKKAANKVIQASGFEHRIPCDLYFWQTGIFNYIVSDQMYFIHDRSQGSVLENAK